MSAQLWEIELAGPVVVEGPEMVAKRGRLMRLVADWPGLGWQQMLEDSGFDNVTIGPPVDTFGGAIGEAKARSFDVYGYAFLAHRT